MRIIANIEGEEITEHEDGSVTFTAKAAVDTDGIGPLHGDPDAQTDTSLHYNGKALNADEDIYIVTPPILRDKVKGVVLGCLVIAHNTQNGRTTSAVCGDIGPRKKLGEISVACAKALGINPSPTKGGEERHVIQYTFYPGRAALVNGKQYALQPK